MFIAGVALILILQWTQTVLVPIVIGVLVAYALEPLVSGLVRARESAENGDPWSGDLIRRWIQVLDDYCVLHGVRIE